MLGGVSHSAELVLDLRETRGDVVRLSAQPSVVQEVERVGQIAALARRAPLSVQVLDAVLRELLRVRFDVERRERDEDEPEDRAEPARASRAPAPLRADSPWSMSVANGQILTSTTTKRMTRPLGAAGPIVERRHWAFS
jgi:hypothetical protein